MSYNTSYLTLKLYTCDLPVNAVTINRLVNNNNNFNVYCSFILYVNIGMLILFKVNSRSMKQYVYMKNKGCWFNIFYKNSHDSNNLRSKVETFFTYFGLTKLNTVKYDLKTKISS